MPLNTKPKIASGLLTDVGRQRIDGPNQDDGVVVELPTGGLYAVADGMGGHAAGELASRVALEGLVKCYTTGNVSPPERLIESVQAANTDVIRHAVGECVGMGTTLLVAVIDGGALLMAHVGDSRGYLMRGGKLQQLTEDHSWVAEQIRMGFLTPEEAKNYQWKSVVSNALGGEHRVRLEIFGMPLKAGDRLLLCSDGLSGVVEEEVIARYLLRADDPKAVAALLVNAANEEGGPDNITVLVIDIGQDSKMPAYRLPQRQAMGPEYAEVLLNARRSHSLSSYFLLTTVYFTLLGVALIQSHWVTILCTGLLIIAGLLFYSLWQRQRSARQADEMTFSIQKASQTSQPNHELEEMHITQISGAQTSNTQTKHTKATQSDDSTVAVLSTHGTLEKVAETEKNTGRRSTDSRANNTEANNSAASDNSQPCSTPANNNGQLTRMDVLEVQPPSLADMADIDMESIEVKPPHIEDISK